MTGDPESPVLEIQIGLVLNVSTPDAISIVHAIAVHERDRAGLIDA
jgi:hypothetical protein